MATIQNLTEIDFVSWLITGFMIFSIVIAAYEIICKFSKIIGKPIGWIRSQDKDHDLIIETTENLLALEKKQEDDMLRSDEYDKKLEEQLSDFIKNIQHSIDDGYKKIEHDMELIEDKLRTERQEERECDRKQSLEAQKELQIAYEETLNSIKSLSSKIDEVQKTTNQRFLENLKKQNKRVRAELKDKIADSYRRYCDTKKINKIELEALEGLIEEYEAADGKNSFVHSIVQKEMYTWKKIE